MFSKQLRTIFTVLGNALLALAAMPADADATHVEMTGQQYIDKLDKPDTGKEVATVITGTAAEVFTGQPPVDPAAVFGATPQTAAAVFSQGAAAGLPTYTMTESAEGFTREAYHASDWTDETLIAAGFMIVTPAPVMQDTSPNAPPGAASGTAPAPSAPPTASTPAAAPAAPANTDAPPPAGGATLERDSSGLPYDARIHSGGRTKKADGTWQKRKGVSDVEVARVTAELRSSAPAQVATPFTPLNTAAPAPAPAAPSAAPAAPAAAPASAAPGSASDVPTGFAPLCKWITANGFSMLQALEFAKPYGITAMGLLAQDSNAAFIPLIHADMVASRKA